MSFRISFIPILIPIGRVYPSPTPSQTARAGSSFLSPGLLFAPLASKKHTKTNCVFQECHLLAHPSQQTQASQPWFSTVALFGTICTPLKSPQSDFEPDRHHSLVLLWVCLAFEINIPTPIVLQHLSFLAPPSPRTQASQS